ncbi:hypothetical protein NOM01_07710 [Sporolactobacillus sp. STSJ-5]|uniref:hypothetical protein n=1 Tax=Sporolactobacillus sp. STSJ-5 TaxID=2965076 RepID=UPI0021076878|nr:hypothetical protein [Sporolactobacillus sp. STSJ-5]MCQ2009892.1 hypothetical protein [Sporolactobacillus sp. STSJ-5]
MKTIIFKEYNMNQLILPMDFSDSIPKNHMARAVNAFVDGIDRKVFLEAYKGGGRPANHPQMMTKILLSLRLYAKMVFLSANCTCST